jgi:cobalt-precorrin 5A hydrolase
MSAGGIGCRKGCDARDIVQAIERALEAAGQAACDLHALYAPDFKREERGLALAAEQLGKPLVFLPLRQLQAQASHALSASAHTLSRFGVPSIAETAALAGAGAFDAATAAAFVARLLGPRQLVGGASCALAIAEVVS